MSRLIAIIYCIFLLSSTGFQLSAARIDSLKTAYKKSSSDSISILILSSWKEELNIGNFDLREKLDDKIDSICNLNLTKTEPLSQSQIVFFKRQKASALSKKGISKYRQDGDVKEAISYLSKSLKICNEIKDIKGSCNVHNSLGGMYFIMGDFTKAIENYHASLKISEETGNLTSQASTLINIGAIQGEMNQTDKALESLLTAIRLLSEAGNSNSKKHKANLARANNNLAKLYSNNGQFSKALSHNKRSLNIDEELGDSLAMGFSLSGIGTDFYHLGYFEKAEKYYKKSLAIFESMGHKEGICESSYNLCNLYRFSNNSLAIKYGLAAVKLANELNFNELTSLANSALYEAYRYGNQPENAIKYFRIHLKAKKAIEIEKNRRELIQQEFKFEYERKAAADSIQAMQQKEVQELKIAKQEAELSSKQKELYLLLGGIALAVLISLLSYWRYKNSQQQKEFIEKQKGIVDLKNKEITDSIIYAKRIQLAVLPSNDQLKKAFPNSFVYYKPKDIVGGDFYWLEQKNDTTFIAACDCTGHGVPGAMVSVICNNGLNRSVREENLTCPSEILSKTRKIVINEFDKSNEDVKDGMDIALCALQGNVLKYSGANRCLLIVRSNEILEYKGDKQPIANYEYAKDFYCHEIDLFPKDTIYMFSDGFASQFGGEHGKKYKSGMLKKFLLSISQEPMTRQRELLKKEFNNWKGSEEQVDDVCVVGFRV